MKKFIALAIAIVMLAALAVPAFAATSGTTEITYTVGQSYELTVPASLTVGGDAGNITVSNYNLLADKMVQVSVAATAWTLGEKAYKLNAVAADGVIATFEANNSVEVAATFVNDAPTAAGTYTTTVTFTGAIVSANS